MQHFQPRKSTHTGRVNYVFYPAKQGSMVKLSVGHRDGGMNYFSGGTEKRGIEISITTIELKDSGFGSGVQMETSTPMSDANGRLLLMETTRYSQKKIDEIVLKLDAIAPTISATWPADRHAVMNMIRSAVGEPIAKAA